MPMQPKILKLFVSLFIGSLIIILCLSYAPKLPFLKWKKIDASNKTVVVLAEDLRNGGIIGVVVGIQEACQNLNWDLKIFDISSSLTIGHQSLIKGLNLKADGVILVGGDIVSMSSDNYLKKYQQKNIPIVGWHVAPYPGSVANTPVKVNVTTDSRKVAIAAAGLVQPKAGELAGVVIFTDSRINIALEKANQMVKALESCERCRLLSFEDIPFY